MAAPITPNIEYGLIDGQVVTIFTAEETSTGGTKVMTTSLATADPWIDTRIGHPVLGMAFITNETNNTGTEIFTPDKEMERGTAPDSTGEWQLTDYNTVTRYSTPDQNGFLMLTYIAFGGTRA